MLTREPEGPLETFRGVLMLLALALAMFAWLAPNNYFPWPSFHGQLAMVAATAVTTLWLVIRRSAAVQRLPWLALVLLAASAIPWVQWAAGLIFFAGDALMSSLFLLGFAAAVMLGLRLTDTFGLRAVMEALSLLFVSSSILCVGMALYQWLHLDYLFIFVLDIAPGARPVANLAQPNLLASLLVLGLMGCAYLFQVGRLGAGVAGGLAVYLLFGIVMTQSRTALLELLVVGAWLCWRARDSKVTPAVVAVALSVTVLLTFAWPQFSQEMSATGGGRPLEEATSAGTRPTHWLSMLDAIQRRPWFGYGWNQNTVAHYEVAPDHRYTGEVLGSSHNLLLDLLVWNGVPLGLLLAAALVAWFAVTVRRERSHEAAFAMAIVVALFVHSMLEFPIHFFYFLLPLGVLMGGLSTGRRRWESWALPKPAAPLVLLALTGIGTAVAIEYLAIERETYAKRFENARIGLDMPREAPPTIRLITQQREFLQFVGSRARDDMPPQEIEWMGQVARRFPNWTSLTRYAAALAHNGQPEAARAALERICKIQVPTDCRNAETRWRVLGESAPSLQAVAFPMPAAMKAAPPAH